MTNESKKQTDLKSALSDIKNNQVVNIVLFSEMLEAYLIDMDGMNEEKLDDVRALCYNIRRILQNV